MLLWTRLKEEGGREAGPEISPCWEGGLGIESHRLKNWKPISYLVCTFSFPGDISFTLV